MDHQPYDDLKYTKIDLTGKPRVYTSSKEDVADAIRDFKKGDKIEVYEDDSEGWITVLLDDISLDGYHVKFFEITEEYEGIFSVGKVISRTKIRKLQPSEPVKNGECVELNNEGFYTLIYKEMRKPLERWVSHKDFAGYVHSNGVLSDTAWSLSTDHAIGVRFKVGE